MTNHIEKAKAALESCGGWPVNGTTDMALLAIAHALVAIAEERGTCELTANGPWGYPYVCSACGASFDPDVNNGEFNYCPNCGRKVVN